MHKYDPAIPANIIHQTQNHKESCWATCAAMVSGVSKLQVEDELTSMGVNPNAHLLLENLERVLAHHKILLRSTHKSVMQSPPGLFIVSVPYIGTERIRFNVHAIVVDTRKGKIEVYDPLKGFPSMPPSRRYASYASDATVEFNLSQLTYGIWRCVDCNIGTP